MHHGNNHSQQNSSVRLPNANFKTSKSSFPTAKGETHNGTMSHYHFVADWRLGLGRVLARRIPCGCAFCRSGLELPWDSSEPVLEQERHRNLTGASNQCVLKEVVGDSNAWKLIKVSPDPKRNVAAEVSDVFGDVLDMFAADSMENIAVSDEC